MKDKSDAGVDGIDTVEATDPVIRQKSTISRIWILPLVALLIGVGMVYNDWRNRGVLVQVQFDTAEGLEARKTVVKNRNVDIGIVQKISFSEDKSKILVDIEVQKSMASFLVEDSEFWVVRPRIGAEGISGFGTLLSGAYIEIEPGKSNIERAKFVGLERPPVTSLNADGIHLKLLSKGSKSLNVGNPILHRGFKVGAVESKSYDDIEQVAHYDIFIQAPFHNLVTQNTSFWNVSGLSISTSTQGIEVNVASFDTLVSGGVEFDLLDGAPPGAGVPQNHEFTLYDSQDSIDAQREYKHIQYVILVEDNVGGLHKGAPVEYRGIRLGTVAEPYMEFWEIIDIAGVGKEERIPVVINLEPERLMKNGFISIDVFQGMVEQWIKGGLTASIENANLITGSLKVTLQPGGERVEQITKFGQYSVIPSEPGGFASLTDKLENILATLDSLPLESTVKNMNELIDTTDSTMKVTSESFIRATKTLDTLDQTMRELEATLEGVQPNSEVYRSIEKVMRKVDSTLDELEPLVKEVTNQPNSLVFGKPVKADKQPKAKKGDDK
jgi:paraquat-inducible protein B